jgi:hypothetical protein
MQWELTNYVKDNYTKSGLRDGEFARQAEEKLGFPVTKHNVAGARETLEIPSRAMVTRELNKVRRSSADPQSLTDIYTRLRALEQRVQVYIDGCQCDPRSPRNTK